MQTWKKVLLATIVGAVFGFAHARDVRSAELRGRNIQGDYVKQRALTIVNDEITTAGLMKESHRIKVLKRIEWRINQIN